MGLALGELEARTSALLAVLLALFHARIAREQAGLLQTLAQLGVVDLQRARDAVADGARLSARTAAVDGYEDVEFVVGLGERERLLDDHLQHFIAEVLVERPVVDCDLTRSLPEMHACGRGLPPSRAVVFNQSQESSSVTPRLPAARAFGPRADGSRRDI